MFETWQKIGVMPMPGAVERLTKMLGRPPKSYRAFAEETAAAWKAGDQTLAAASRGEAGRAISVGCPRRPPARQVECPINSERERPERRGQDAA